MTDAADVLRDLLKIDEDDLATEWHEQGERYARAARYAARCEAAHATAELVVKETEADLYKEIRDRDLMAGSKRAASEEAVKQSIRREPRWRAVERDRITCLEVAKTAAGILRAMEQRERALKWITIRHFGEWDSKDHSLKGDAIDAALDRARAAMRQ